MLPSSSGRGRRWAWSGGTGPGKSSFISVARGRGAGPPAGRRQRPPPRARSGSCPRPPCPADSGLEPTGFSHILSARGLDVLDDALGTARRAMAEDPSAENIELFTDLQEQFQANGGYEAESVMARLADGLGLRQELLLEDIDDALGRPASPGRPHAGAVPRTRADDPRRADQPPRPLGQALAARRAGPLRRRPPRGEPRPQAARPLHHQGAAHLEPTPDRVEGQLLDVSRPSTRRTSPSASARRSSSSGRSPASRLWPTPCGPARRSGPARPSHSTSGSSDMQAQRTQVDKRERASKFRSRRRPARARHLSRWPSWACATAPTRSSPRSPSTPAGATTSSSSAATAPGSRPCCAAWPACRSPPTAWSRSVPTSCWATSPRSTSRSTRPCTRAGQHQ